MLLIGVSTAYAAANTYEVIDHRDVPISSVVRPIKLTQDVKFDALLVEQQKATYNPGEFGIPAKVKLPEAPRLITVNAATRQSGRWEAERGVAQAFLCASPRQKMFGCATIYMRTNTATTQHLGEVMQGDTVNIVTTDGWQLGYQVSDSQKDPSELHLNGGTSEIVVVLVDDHSKAITSFTATLYKVGDRI